VTVQCLVGVDLPTRVVNGGQRLQAIALAHEGVSAQESDSIIDVKPDDSAFDAVCLTRFGVVP
jgi:hypothetical protein